MPVTDLTYWRLLFKRNCQLKYQAPNPEDVVIGYKEQGDPVLWLQPSKEAASHNLLLAASGTGKSVMLALAIALEVIGEHNTQKDEARTAYIIIDPKGDLVKLIIMALASLNPKLLERVVYLDPFTQGSTIPFPFNISKLPLGKTPLDVRCLQISNLVNAVSTGVGKQAHLSMGQRQLDTISNCLLGATSTKHPQANLLWSLDSLILKQGMKRLAKITSSKRAKQFLLNTSLSPELQSSCASRLRTAFALTHSLEQIITTNSCLRFNELTAPGSIVLLNLGQPTGGMTELSTFWASLWTQMCFEHLMERESPYPGHHVRLIIDEVQVVAEVLEKTAETILTMGRSKNISLTAVSQGSALISDVSTTLLPVLFSNVNNKIIGRLNAMDTEILAKMIAPGKGVDESLAEVRSKFIARTTNLKDREFMLLQPGQRERFRSADVDMEAWQEAEGKHATEIKKMKTRLAQPKSKPRVTLDEVVPYQRRGAKNNPAPRNNHPANKARKDPRSPWG